MELTPSTQTQSAGAGRHKGGVIWELYDRVWEMGSLCLIVLEADKPATNDKSCFSLNFIIILSDNKINEMMYDIDWCDIHSYSGNNVLDLAWDSGFKAGFHSELLTRLYNAHTVTVNNKFCIHVWDAVFK